MDTRSILDFDFPNELTEAFSDYLGNDDVYRLAGMCRFFRDALSEYKVNRLAERAMMNADIRAKHCNAVEYRGPEGLIANRILRYKNLVIGASTYQLWAWNSVTGELIWEYKIPNNCSNLNLPKLSIIGNKIICMLNNQSSGYGVNIPYILIVNAETGVLYNQYTVVRNPNELILENITTVNDQHIIIKRNNGMITCYDTDLNCVESYQSDKAVTDGEYQIILSTSQFIVDIDFCIITIINRSNGTISTVLTADDPCAAIINQDRLICRVKSNTTPFVIIDLNTAKVIYEYQSKLVRNTKWTKKDCQLMHAIVMRNDDVFFISNRNLYYVNTKNNKTINLTKLPCKAGNASLEISDNYLFLHLDRRNISSACGILNQWKN